MGDGLTLTTVKSMTDPMYIGMDTHKIVFTFISEPH